MQIHAYFFIIYAQESKVNHFETAELDAWYVVTILYDYLLPHIF